MLYFFLLFLGCVFYLIIFGSFEFCSEEGWKISEGLEGLINLIFEEFYLLNVFFFFSGFGFLLWSYCFNLVIVLGMFLMVWLSLFVCFFLFFIFFFNNWSMKMSE